MDPPEAPLAGRPEQPEQPEPSERPGRPEELEMPDAASWAMQLAVRAERAHPPAHRAVCAAAAMAVARVLTEPDERWQEAVRRWEAGPVRKVTRRARGVRWTAVQRLPGVTVEWAGAEVRAFVPAPVTRVPPELARLQVAGLDLPDESGDAGDSGKSSETPPPMPPYAAIALNPAVRMSTGKAAAQCGHVAHLLVRQAAEPDRSAWIAAGARVHLVRVAGGEAWARAVAGAAVTVRDAGFTEVPAGTMTAVGRIVRAAPRPRA
ncbi:MAG TPA: peptidyl-tRNA hydrolase [Streptosporangiaceae bacterium]|nr:peptidyl-tRNA hydrolase [Streptosporangiaceae bacterium]